MQNSENYVTVSELNFYISRIIDAEELLHGIALLGEVSGASMSGGNLYFTLKDESTQISACCFGIEKTYRPANGEKVLVRGSLDYYQKGGKISFIVQNIKPYGMGDLYVELENRKQKLQKEGIFDAEHKKPMPQFIKRLGVVTSINGAVISDIVSTIRRKNLLMDILVIDTKVQGEGAAESMCKALKVADNEGLGAIILARGGGSFEDLMPFNDEGLARTLYQLNTFVISAVGHETDYSISDMSADVRALTPTAAAEMVAFDPYELASSITEMLSDMEEIISDKISSYSNKISQQITSIKFGIGNKLSDADFTVKKNLVAMAHKIDAKLAAGESEISGLLAKLSALNPAGLLEKGFFKVVKDGKNVQSVAQVAVGDEVSLYAKDGDMRAVVRSVNYKGQ